MSDIIKRSTFEIISLSNFIGLGITVSIDGTKATIHVMEEQTWNHIEVPASKINQLFAIKDKAVLQCREVLGV